MGVEHYLVCRQCNQYIDIHKSYSFSLVIGLERPPVGCQCAETGFNESLLNGGYWESRGLWFLWHHRGHKGIEMLTDSYDEWFQIEPILEEKFPHDDDLEIRKKNQNNKP